MLSAATLPISGSAEGSAQPPCSKPPRRSSSGLPGACTTPSRVRFMNTTILLIRSLLGDEAGSIPASHTLYTNGFGSDRHLPGRSRGPHRRSDARRRRLAVWTQAGKDHLVALHLVSGAGLDGNRRLVDHASRHLCYGATGSAADVLVVGAARFVARLAIADAVALHERLLLQGQDCPQDRRIVGARDCFPDRAQQLIEGPGAVPGILDERSHSVGDWAGARQLERQARTSSPQAR